MFKGIVGEGVVLAGTIIIAVVFILFIVGWQLGWFDSMADAIIKAFTVK